VLPGPLPQAWATAMVLSFVRGLEVLFQRIAQEGLLEEFGATRFQQRSGVKTPATWTALADAVTPIVGGGTTTVKKLLFDHLLLPHLANTTADPKQEKKAWSVILFGPPGTGKTKIAEEIAGSLGWPLVTIDTSDFLAQGVDKMAHQARLLFRKLEQLREVVVFIDEVEEFVRVRTDCDRQSRLTTTGMLTLLQRFRSNKRAILILATNHFEAFDPAITRPGRFDLMVLLKPPSIDAKCDIWRQRRSKCSAKVVDTEIRAIKSIGTLVERFTFDEWTAFMDRYQDQWGEKGANTKELTKVLQETAGGLTIDKDEWRRWARHKSAVR